MAKDWMLAHSGKGIASSSDFLSSTANERCETARWKCQCISVVAHIEADFLKEGFSRVRLPFHVCETLAMRGGVGRGTGEVADRRFAYHIDGVSCLAVV